MSKKNFQRMALTASAIAAILTLAACGGGGGGSSSPAATVTGASAPSGASSAQTATSANVTTPAYTASSAQLAIFNTVNAYRQQCGFPTLTENTTLDTAAQNHAIYMIDNGYAVTDSEVSGNAGYTGASYVTRAIAAGYPTAATTMGTWGGSAGGSGPLTAAQFGNMEASSWISGVYHTGIMFNTGSIAGIGEDEASASGTTFSDADILTVQNTGAIANGPLTFPCQGVTGVPYDGLAETPTAPNVSANGWGTPVLVQGNLTDTIALSSGTMTGPSGNINLQLLDSANDPNGELKSYSAVAYPTSPLQPNTTYSVNLTGTYNGTAFSRSFSFTTGNAQG
jgi:uncharacterized protein YkwD